MTRSEVGVSSRLSGLGEYGLMLAATESAIGEGPWLLGERFTMADAIFGGTVSTLLRFEMLEARPAVTSYAARLSERPAALATHAKSAAMIEEHGLAPQPAS